MTSLPSSRPLYSFPSYLKKNPNSLQVLDLFLHTWPCLAPQFHHSPLTHFTPDTPVFWNTRNFSPRQILALSFPSVRVALPLDLQMAPPSNPSGFPVQMSTPQRGHALPSNILPSHNSLLYLHCPYQSLKLLLTIALFDHLSLSRDYKHHETETAPVLVATVTTVHSTVPGTWKVCLIILVDSTELKLE